MAGFITFAYGVLVYFLFLGTFLYAVLFVGNIAGPKTIDSGQAGPLAQAVGVNVLLLGAFALQHSVMARRSFKRRWTRLVPKPAERSTYVLLASLILLLLYWQWRPIPQPVWTVTHPAGVVLLTAAFWLGWVTVLASTFMISHLELFGLRQVLARLRSNPLPEPVFKTPFLYRRIRHPIYFGFILAFWATPQMSYGHLLFALATTGYILIGILLEERDLVALFGEPYRRYQREVGMLLPTLRTRRAQTSKRHASMLLAACVGTSTLLSADTMPGEPQTRVQEKQAAEGARCICLNRSA